METRLSNPGTSFILKHLWSNLLFGEHWNRNSLFPAISDTGLFPASGYLANVFDTLYYTFLMQISGCLFQGQVEGILIYHTCMLLVPSLFRKGPGLLPEHWNGLYHGLLQRDFMDSRRHLQDAGNTLPYSLGTRLYNPGNSFILRHPWTNLLLHKHCYRTGIFPAIFRPISLLNY